MPEQAASRLAGVGHHTPRTVVSNAELAGRLDTSDAWIRERVGIRSRALAGPDETVVDMAAAAASAALRSAGQPAAAVDLVVVATCTNADRMPSTAARVAQRLGVRAPAAFDVNAACAGFSYALACADHAIRAGAATVALVIGADKMSDYLDWQDRSSCVIFGDGAGAAVVCRAPAGTAGVGPVAWGSKPEMGDAITVRAEPGSPRPTFRQTGTKVFRWATTELAAVARQACRSAGTDPSALAAFVPHQANLRIIETIAEQIGADRAILARDVVDSGNTNAASIPTALSKLMDGGGMPAGAPVLLLGFGGGLTFSAQVVNVPEPVVIGDGG